MLQAPHWPFLIDVYFFLGGLAGGAFVVATAAHLLDPRRHRDVSRIGYYLALLALLPCPVILIVDLGRPDRFLNMMGAFNITSPMSMGSWALLGFSAMAGLAALLTLLEDVAGRDFASPKRTLGLVGGFFAFFLAAYPGVLLGATVQPLWTHGRSLGALFLAVGASSGAAGIALLLALLRGRAAGALARLNTVVVIALALQAVAILIFLISVWASGSPDAARALASLLAGSHAALFWLGAIGAGLVVPFLLGLRGMRRASTGLTALASVLVLVGGFVVKTVIMTAGQA